MHQFQGDEKAAIYFKVVVLYWFQGEGKEKRKKDSRERLPTNKLNAYWHVDIEKRGLKEKSSEKNQQQILQFQIKERQGDSSIQKNKLTIVILLY